MGIFDWLFGKKDKYIGEDKYVGEFKDGMKNGQGTETSSNGIITNGVWVLGNLFAQKEEEK